MAKIKTTISLDPELKNDATALFDKFGLDLSTAIGVFLAQAVREQKIPFEIKMASVDELEKSKYDLMRSIESEKDFEEEQAIDQSIKMAGEIAEDLLIGINDAS